MATEIDTPKASMGKNTYSRFPAPQPTGPRRVLAGALGQKRVLVYLRAGKEHM